MNNRKLAVIAILGLASGLPLGLTNTMLQSWMKFEKIDITIIGIASLVGMPYALKFLWAPFIDRYAFRILGRRRGWILVAQLAVMAGTIGMSFSNPQSHLSVLSAFAFFVAFASATNDIAFDAYRIEVLDEKEMGPGTSLYILGYRVGMIVSGGASLVLADRISWQNVYLVMAATMLVGVAATFAAPNPIKPASAPKSLRDAIVLPLLEFFKRRGAIETLLFAILYKLDVALTLALTTPFMLELGFSQTEVGAIVKSFGVGATIVGALVGGSFMVKLGVKASLWVFGVIQALSGLSYMLLAHVGKNTSLMISAVTIENFCSGMGITAFSAFLMQLCDRRFTASQYALLSSFMGLSRYLVAAPSGFFVKAFGWEYYYLACALSGVPALIMLLRYDRWTRPQTT